MANDQEIIQNYQLESVKENPMNIMSIKNPTPEMIMIAIEHGVPMRPSYHLTDDMVNACIRHGNPSIFRMGLDLKPIVDENAIINYIYNQQRISIQTFMFCQNIIENCNVSKNAAIEICKYSNLFVDMFPQYFKDEASKQVIIQAYLQKLLDIKQATGNINLSALDAGFSSRLTLSDKNWAFIESNQILTDRFIQQYSHPIPYRIAMAYLANQPIYNMINLKEQSVETCHAFIDYISQNGMNTTDYSHYEYQLDNIFNSEEFKTAFSETDGSFIRFIRKPSAKLQKIAITCNPQNIEYIDNPTEKICLLVLAKDPSFIQYIEKRTKRICKAASIPYESPEELSVKHYPHPYYLCKFNEDLADESNLIKILVVPGNKMETFLQQSVTIGFGNIYDDRPRNIASICSYQPITAEEYQVLSKLQLTNIQAGDWSDMDV